MTDKLTVNRTKVANRIMNRVRDGGNTQIAMFYDLARNIFTTAEVGSMMYNRWLQNPYKEELCIYDRNVEREYILEDMEAA